MSTSGSNAPIGVAQAAEHTATIGVPCERSLASCSSRRLASMRRCVIERGGMDVVRAQAEDAGGAGDAVVDVGVGDDRRARAAVGEAGGPGVAERDVAGREQRREIRQRAAGGDEAA